jgi:hypothetical protein
MLRFLLDEHLDPAIAQGVRTCHAAVEIVALAQWDDGAHLGAPDDVLLRAAYAKGLTLVTFDQRTIVPLLRSWGQAGNSHGGVIFISSAAFIPNDVGGIVRALIRLWEQLGAGEWTNRAVYLQRD